MGEGGGASQATMNLLSSASGYPALLLMVAVNSLELITVLPHCQEGLLLREQASAWQRFLGSSPDV